ncbi:MAG: FKBP-type peptidyl-prolyl cis-trans isomerase [Spirosomataceae bacterium]
MKKTVVLFLAIAPFVAFSQNKPASKPTPKPSTTPAAAPAPANPIKNGIDSVSYAIGVSIASNLKQQGFADINLAAMQKAMDDVLKSKPTIIDLQQCNSVIQNFFQAQQAKKYATVKTASQKFLVENKTKPGVVTLPSGLQYQVMKAGDGPKPTTADRVKVHYHGTLIDGTVFDSSVQRNEPAVFGVTQVIQGWVEALQLMPVGSKWKLFIPYQMAYGEQGSGNIPPFSTLVFEVELLGIEK